MLLLIVFRFRLFLKVGFEAEHLNVSPNTIIISDSDEDILYPSSDNVECTPERDFPDELAPVPISGNVVINDVTDTSDTSQYKGNEPAENDVNEG
jgi:hypothetical protein